MSGGLWQGSNPQGSWCLAWDLKQAYWPLDHNVCLQWIPGQAVNVDFNQRTWGAELPNACCIVYDQYVCLPSIATIPINKSCFLVKPQCMIFTYIPCILIIITVFFLLSPTDAQLNILKNTFKFTLKLTLKSCYMFWCSHTIIRECTIWAS